MLQQQLLVKKTFEGQKYPSTAGSATMQEYGQALASNVAYY